MGHAAVVLLTFVVLVAPVTAGAQSLATTLRGSVLTSEPATTGVIGGTVSVQVGERLAAGVDMDFFRISDWARTFTITGSVAVPLSRRGWAGPVAPYVLGGVGYQRQAVELASLEVLGPIVGASVGERFCPAPGRGPSAPGGAVYVDACATDGLRQWGVGDLPAFYARRLGVLIVPDSGAWPSRVFEDVALTTGGGLRLRPSDRLTVGIEARFWTAADSGNTRTSALVGGTLGYRF